MLQDIAKVIAFLKSPDNDQALYVHEEGRFVVDATGQYHYSIQDDIPILLPVKANEQHRTSDLHQKFDSRFDYREHYRIDAEFFDYFADSADEATAHENRRLQQAIMAEIPTGIQKILDVGCGKAWIAAHYRNSGHSVFSVDIAPRNVIKALKTYPGARHFGLVADLHHLPFIDKCFDCVVAAEVMEHVANPRHLLTSLWRVVEPGGILIITTPYNEKIDFHLCVHCNRPTPSNAHLHSFTEENVLPLLPTGQVGYKKIYSFSNRLLARMQTHLVLKYLPYRIWREVDRVSNAIIDKPQRLLIKLTKEQ